MKHFSKYIFPVLTFLPVITYARTVKTVAQTFVDLLNRMSILVMGFALFFFVIGIVRFIATSGDDKSREQGKQLMFWGVIALAAMVAVWGLVNIIKVTFFG